MRLLPLLALLLAACGQTGPLRLPDANEAATAKAAQKSTPKTEPGGSNNPAGEAGVDPAAAPPPP